MNLPFESLQPTIRSTDVGPTYLGAKRGLCRDYFLIVDECRPNDKWLVAYPNGKVSEEKKNVFFDVDEHPEDHFTSSQIERLESFEAAVCKNRENETRIPQHPKIAFLLAQVSAHHQILTPFERRFLYGVGRRLEGGNTLTPRQQRYFQMVGQRFFEQIPS